MLAYCICLGIFYTWSSYLSRRIYLCLPVYPEISHRFYICQGICLSVLRKPSSDEVHLMQSPLCVCRTQSESALEFTCKSIQRYFTTFLANYPVSEYNLLGIQHHVGGGEGGGRSLAFVCDCEFR
jgi:hypothetical protein